MLPISIQFNHSFVEHTVDASKKTGLNQTVSARDCAIFHHLFLPQSTHILNDNFTIYPIFVFSKIINFDSLIFLKPIFSAVTRGPPSIAF